SVPRLHHVRRLTEVEHNHADLATIPGIDRAEIDADRVLHSQPAPWTYLALIARRQLDGNAGRHRLGDARDKLHALKRMQIHTRVFVRSVRVDGKYSIFVEFLDADFHRSNFAIITSSCPQKTRA